MTDEGNYEKLLVALQNVSDAVLQAMADVGPLDADDDAPGNPLATLGRAMLAAPSTKDGPARIITDAPDFLVAALQAHFDWIFFFKGNMATAQRHLDSIPSNALRVLSELAGQPWNLATRRILDGVQRSLMGSPQASAVPGSAGHDVLCAGCVSTHAGDPRLLSLSTDLDERISEVLAIRGMLQSGAGNGHDASPARDYSGGNGHSNGRDAPPANGTGAAGGAPPAGASRKGTINARMMELVQRDLERVTGWTAAQWARELGCARSAVVKTRVWQDLAIARDRQRAEKAADRRRKPRPR